MRNSEKLGGEGKVVQTDESKGIKGKELKDIYCLSECIKVVCLILFVLYFGTWRVIVQVVRET